MSVVTAYSKKAFLKRMGEILDAEDIVVVSTSFANYKVKGRGKNKTKELHGSIAADIFKNEDTVSDIMNAFPVQIVAGNKEIFSKETMDIVEYQDKYHKIKKGK